MIAALWKTPLLLGAVIAPVLLTGCNQSAGLSASGLTEGFSHTLASLRPNSHSDKDKDCLTRAMYFESNRSSRDGLIAVGTVVMNRLESGKHGDTICEVVGEKGQFAAGVLSKPMDAKALPDVQEAATAVLRGERHAKVKEAMFFHTAGLKFPYKNMHYVLVAGGNAFYEKRRRGQMPQSTPEVAVAAVQRKGKPAVASAPPAAQPRGPAPAEPSMARIAPNVPDQSTLSFDTGLDDADAIEALIDRQSLSLQEY